jgi:uncharacterized membrane protein YhiD involved in acid resistance
MKEIKLEPFLQARTVALLIGLAIGLGLVVHGAFFFLAFLIALAAAADCAIEAMLDHHHQHCLQESLIEEKNTVSPEDSTAASGSLPRSLRKTGKTSVISKLSVSRL